MLQQPFIWSPNQTAVTLPNALFDFDSKKCTLDSLKDQPGGFGLVAWAVHPLLLTKYKWGNARQYNYRESFKKFLSLNSNNDLPPETNFFHRVNSQEKIADIESQHPSTYLTSILDLTAEHLPYLRKLKEANLVHLIDNYGVDINKDLVEMYFHFPYPEHNTTLHLHVRVNQGAHPMERTRSFSLNEVINCLEKGDRIYDLILARDTIYSENMEFLQNIEGVTLIETKNPFFLTTPLIECNDSNISQGSFKIRGLEI